MGPDRRAVAGLHPGGSNLLDAGRPQPADSLRGVEELRLVDVVIAPDDGRDETAVAGDEERGLGGPLGANA